jgi:hypothetical protein
MPKMIASCEKLSNFHTFSPDAKASCDRFFTKQESFEGGAK